MIRIRNIKIDSDKEKSSLSASIDIPYEARCSWANYSQNANAYGDYSYLSDGYAKDVGDCFCLSFSVEKRYGEYLTNEVYDAFVVALLYYALATEQDIVCAGEVSSRLLLALNEELLPYLCKASGIKSISVYADERLEPLPAGTCVGTGMSAGVDSLYTLQRYGFENTPKTHRITHLTNFDVGSERWYFPKTNDPNLRKLSIDKFVHDKRARIAKAREISNNCEKEFLSIDSNISSLYRGCFERSHLYRTISAVFAVQKMFSIYYVSSSGCSIEDYSLGIAYDPAHYEQVLLPLLSTDTLKFVLAGKQVTRLEKLDAISSFDVAQKHLLVCSRGIKHCYSCNKEYRTMIAIELLGKKDEYSLVFDPARCDGARVNAYAWLLSDKDKHPAVSYYLYEQARKTRQIPWQSYVKHYLRICRDIFLHKSSK